MGRADGFQSQAEHDEHVAAALEDLYAQERAAGRAPSPSELWAAAHGIEPPEQPLTVAEAARRAGVHHQTVRRRLAGLAEAGLAHKIGRKWLLAAEAVPALRERPRPVTPGKSARGRRRPQAAPDGELW